MLIWVKVHLQYYPLFRLKWNTLYCISEWECDTISLLLCGKQMWAWALFLSRFAGTVMWWESHLFLFPLPLNVSLYLSNFLSAPSHPVPVSSFPFFLLSVSYPLYLALSLCFQCLPSLFLSVSLPTAPPREVMLLSAHSSIKQLTLIILLCQQHKM